MSTAIVALLRGDPSRALAIHAFAPVFLLGIVTVACISALPNPLRRTIVCQIDGLEQRTGFVFVLMLCLLVYWAVRLIWL